MNTPDRTRVRVIQHRLRDLGFDPGPVDGALGTKTAVAFEKLASAYETARSGLAALPPPMGQAAPGPIPGAWLPTCQMNRIIVHWTAGGYSPSSVDKEHYHVLIDGFGALHEGFNSIQANSGPIGKNYAAHTARLNTGSIGVALCGMLAAREKPFDLGPAPINETQWKTLVEVCRQLCAVYRIAAAPATLLSHAEVPITLGIPQPGKWDITRLPWDAAVQGAINVGNKLRGEVMEVIR